VVAEIFLCFIFEVVFHGRSSSMEGRLPLEVVFILSFYNIWLGPISLSFKFGEDQISGCWDTPIFHFWGRLPWKLIFHWRSSSFYFILFHNISVGPLSLSFKFGEDLTSGCWDILHFVLPIYLWLVARQTDTHTHTHTIVNAGVPLANLSRFDGISSWARLTDSQLLS
jgi:hypothetical protein